ncbi:hypothetical protein IRJ41_023239, partial [Triplophysa rosa]
DCFMNLGEIRGRLCTKAFVKKWGNSNHYNFARTGWRFRFAAYWLNQEKSIVDALSMVEMLFSLLVCQRQNSTK